MNTSFILTPRIAARLAENRLLMKITTSTLFLVSLYLMYRGFVV